MSTEECGLVESLEPPGTKTQAQAPALDTSDLAFVICTRG